MPKTPIVLVVEDEMVLRMRAVDIVEDAGFEAVEAVTADEALEILESRDDISLLFTDIQMPGSLDGLKLAHAVNVSWPNIKIILVSGQVAVTDADKPEKSKFFPKPLEIKDMILQLQEMIGTGVLKVVPNITLNSLLTEENQDLKDQLEKAASDARDLLLKTVLSTEKQQFIIDETGPRQVALENENDALKIALEQAGIDAKELLDQAGIDADERDSSAKLQQLIHDELHHRIKNMLAMASAITNQSIRNSNSMDEASGAIDARFTALARAHDLLSKVSWKSATIESIVKNAIEPYAGRAGKFNISGEDIEVTSSSVVAFAMTLNELCTNTTKFGALSVPTGQVDISWKTTNGRVHFEWGEKGGPPVREPVRKSFGTRMMTSLGQQLNGEVNLDYAVSGFVYTLDVPLESLIKKK